MASATIIAAKSFLAQTSNLSASVLVTPDADALCRVAVLVEDQFGGGSSDAGPSISWTDHYDRNQSSSITGSSPTVGGSLVIRAKSSTSITLSTSSINTGVPVDIYVTVERLQ